MTTLFADSPVTAVIWMIIKCSALLGMAALVQMSVARRASAATRHLVWTLALASVVILPVVSFTLPRWQVPIQAASSPAANSVAADSAEPIVSDSTVTPAASSRRRWCVARNVSDLDDAGAGDPVPDRRGWPARVLDSRAMAPSAFRAAREAV